MRKYQIWQSNDEYSISDFGKTEIDFATNKDFSLKYKPLSEINTESASIQTFLEFLKPIILSDGVHPIYNRTNKKPIEQITNVPGHILSSDQILKYLNGYTILAQETPPYEEIIYKLACYCEELTNEFIDMQSKPSEIDIAKMVLDLAIQFRIEINK